MHTTITRESIQELVHVFYGSVRQDDVLRPVFIEALGEDWTTHLARLVEFWSTILLGSRSFQGKVYMTHMGLAGIKPEHFVHWLGLFGQTASALFDKEHADQFISMAHKVAESLQIGFFGDVVVRHP